MIKDTELRVGNLVTKNGGEFVADFITIQMAHNYNPIELTDELLLKAGFVCIYEDGLYRHEDEPLFELQNRYLMNDGYDHIWDAAFTGVLVTTLHQLQNLYYAMTNGKELTVKP